MRVNHTYGRGGALVQLAAYDVHQAKALARCEPTTGIGPFMNLVTQVMSQEPYAGAKRVVWIVDNASSHHRAFEDRYNATTQPFPWKCTTTDLDDLLARLDRHTADHPEKSSSRLAA